MNKHQADTLSQEVGPHIKRPGCGACACASVERFQGKLVFCCACGNNFHKDCRSLGSQLFKLPCGFHRLIGYQVPQGFLSNTTKRLTEGKWRRTNFTALDNGTSYRSVPSEPRRTLWTRGSRSIYSIYRYVEVTLTDWDRIMTKCNIACDVVPIRAKNNNVQLRLSQAFADGNKPPADLVLYVSTSDSMRVVRLG